MLSGRTDDATGHQEMTEILANSWWSIEVRSQQQLNEIMVAIVNLFYNRTEIGVTHFGSSMEKQVAEKARFISVVVTSNN